MPEFDKNAAYIWTIVVIGLIVPLALAAFASARVHLAKKRLERLRPDDD